MNEFHPHHRPDEFKAVVERCANIVRFLGDKIDIIAVRGASGVVVGSVVSYITGVPLAVIRKDGENAHCYSGISVADGLQWNASRAVWIDDFISSGATYQAVIRRLNGRPRFVILYYSRNQFLGSGPEYTGLLQSQFSEHLYEDHPTPLTDGRFEWPKPVSS